MVINMSYRPVIEDYENWRNLNRDIEEGWEFNSRESAEEYVEWLRKEMDYHEPINFGGIDLRWKSGVTPGTTREKYEENAKGEKIIVPGEITLEKVYSKTSDCGDQMKSLTSIALHELCHGKQLQVMSEMEVTKQDYRAFPEFLLEGQSYYNSKMSSGKAEIYNNFLETVKNGQDPTSTLKEITEERERILSKKYITLRGRFDKLSQILLKSQRTFDEGLKNLLED